MPYVGSLICGFLWVLGDKTLMIVQAEEIAFFVISRCGLGRGFICRLSVRNSLTLSVVG